jgi:hypothetical protein
MQLEPKKKAGKIGKFITQAALALTCTAANLPTVKAQYFKPKNSSEDYITKLQNWADWSGQIGFLGYSETQGRVQAFEPAISLNGKFDNDRIWNIKFVYDSLTGASPNGGLVSSQPQTFTSPSGNANYTIKPGDLALYNQFKDTRLALSSSWSQPLTRLLKGSFGFNFSKEFDYLSLGLNSSISKESEDKNTSVSLGLSYTNDTINPVGGVPIPLATMSPSGSLQPKTSSNENKSTIDLLLGASQILNRNWIVQGNLSLGISSGYMNDPYKVVTIHNDAIGPALGNASSYIYENRPDNRKKQSVYLATKNYFKYGILSLSYRYLTDSWGITSHTIESNFNFGLNSTWRLQPGFRVYNQSAVDFFRYSIGSSESIPQNVTADTRLGKMMAIAPSLKVIKKLEEDKEVSVMLQYYLQSGDKSPSSAVGSQIGQNLFPNLNAFIIHIIYSF